LKRLPAFAVLVAATLAAQAASLPKSVVDHITSSCVLIQAVKGETANAGSGFFVGRGEVLTNYHVVKTAAEDDAKLVLVIGSDPAKRKLADAQVVAGNEELDLALLRTKEMPPFTLRFATERSLQLTQPVWVAGFPFGTKPGLEISLTTGTISALRRDDAGKLQQVQLDAAVNPGNSGGPVLDERGNVVGISRAVVKPTEGSGMAMAIPCSVAEEFLKAARRVKTRTARLTVQGRPPGRGLRIVRVEKNEEVWGTTVSVTVRGSYKTDDAAAFNLEFSNRRRETVGKGAIDPVGLEPRAEETYTIRLRGVGFDDVASCRIVE